MKALSRGSLKLVHSWLESCSSPPVALLLGSKVFRRKHVLFLTAILAAAAGCIVNLLALLAWTALNGGLAVRRRVFDFLARRRHGHLPRRIIYAFLDHLRPQRLFVAESQHVAESLASVSGMAEHFVQQLGNCGGWPVLVLLVGRLVIAVACGVAGGRRIPASCREGGGGAAGVPLGVLAVRARPIFDRFDHEDLIHYR